MMSQITGMATHALTEESPVKVSHWSSTLLKVIASLAIPILLAGAVIAVFPALYIALPIAAACLAVGLLATMIACYIGAHYIRKFAPQHAMEENVQQFTDTQQQFAETTIAVQEGTAHLATDVTQLQKLAERQANDLERLRGQIEELNRLVEAKARENDELQQIVGQAEARAEDLESARKGLQTLCSTLEQESQKMRGNLEERERLVQQIRQERVEYASLLQRVQSQMGIITDGNAPGATLGAQFEEIQKKYRALLEEARAELVHLQMQRRTTEQLLQHFQDQIATLKESSSEQNSLITALTTLNQALARKNAGTPAGELKVLLTQIQDAVLAPMPTLDVLSSATRVIESSRADLGKRVQEIKGLNEEAKERLRALQAQSVGLRASLQGILEEDEGAA